MKTPMLCSECGEFLGFYEGKRFQYALRDKKSYFLPSGRITLLCFSCVRKLKLLPGRKIWKVKSIRYLKKNEVVS